ncbi:hypothetical protein F0562_003279 [Nyssa sinensis]|uniref:HMA domain-containing protein n=1 Tax=Nyssa sinensis TaxID=561372 RepID=A0A5J5BY18_9ASTE|nr:hypothetical protein F0562_003279 [Nyssa sinensis]
MGVGGTLEYLSELMSSGHKHNKRKQLQTVDLKVRMDCDGCELKVKKVLSSLSGVKSVEINRKQQKVSVTGYVDQNKYAAQAYDKKAPPGYVRKVENPTSGTVTRYEDPYITMFSDDNPNACSIM